MKPKLSLLEEKFTLHRLEADAQVPGVVLDSPFFSVTRTPDELSIVVPEGLLLSDTRTEPGWSGIKVLGPLNFGLTGILAGISTLLAEEGISIFAVSTFDTDYILVKKDSVVQAVKTLEKAGYQFSDYGQTS